MQEDKASAELLDQADALNDCAERFFLDGTLPGDDSDAYLGDTQETHL